MQYFKNILNYDSNEIGKDRNFVFVMEASFKTFIVAQGS